MNQNSVDRLSAAVPSMPVEELIEFRASMLRRRSQVEGRHLAPMRAPMRVQFNLKQNLSYARRRHRNTSDVEARLATVSETLRTMRQDMLAELLPFDLGIRIVNAELRRRGVTTVPRARLSTAHHHSGLGDSLSRDAL